MLLQDIKDAYDALMAAKEGLVRRPVNKAKLEALVVQGEDMRQKQRNISQ